MKEKRKIVIEIECKDETCYKCEYLERFDEKGTSNYNCEILSKLLIDEGKQVKRCEECIKNEMKEVKTKCNKEKANSNYALAELIHIRNDVNKMIDKIEKPRCRVCGKLLIDIETGMFTLCLHLPTMNIEPAHFW